LYRLRRRKEGRLLIYVSPTSFRRARNQGQRSSRQSRYPGGESPAVPIAQFRHIAIPQLMISLGMFINLRGLRRKVMAKPYRNRRKRTSIHGIGNHPYLIPPACGRIVPE